MKRLFKLGLVALMGVCSLVGISRAQTTVLIDTSASQTADCTLQDDGSWKMTQDYGLKLKVAPIQSDTTLYQVGYTLKDGDEIVKSGTALVKGRALAWSKPQFQNELYGTPSGTYTLVFDSLLCRQNTNEDWVKVEGAVLPVAVTIEVVVPVIKVTATTAHTEVEETISASGEQTTVKWLVFPSRTTPEFTVTLENGDIDDYLPLVAYAMDEGVSFNTYMTEEPYTFTFKPTASEEEGGPGVGFSSRDALPEYFEDGGYKVGVRSYSDENLDPTMVFIHIGTKSVYGFEAVGATTEDMEGEEYKKFATGEATFAVVAQNAPANWYAEVTATEVSETKIAKSGDSIVTFTTLAGDEFYHAVCKIYNVKGTNVGDTVMVWSNGDGTETAGIPFQITAAVDPTDPTLTIAAGENGTKGDDDVITFEGAAKFTASLSGFADDDNADNYKIEYKVYTKEVYDVMGFDQVGGGLYEGEITLTGVYNGEYVIVFTLTRVGTAETQVGDEIAVYFNVTQYPEPVVEHPAFSVKTVGNTTNADNKIVFADGNAAFDLFAAGLAAGDTTYKFYITIAPEDEFADADIRLAADSLRFENTYEYNGTYVATFGLWWYNKDRQSNVQVADTTITFLVTEGETRPEMEVKTVGNTTEEGKIIFADGKVAFDVLTKNVTVEAGDDSTYKFNITIAAEGEFPLPDVVDFADSLRYETILDYNGTYEAAFELVRLIRGEYQTVADRKITFYVTEGMERPELTVKPVDNTTEDGKIIFADGKIAFDLFTTNVKVEAGDDSTYKFEVSVWNKADKDFPTPDYINYADSVRYETILDYNGEYEVTFELVKRNARGGYDNVTDQKVTFFVTGLEERPEVTVKPVNNTTEEGKIIFADGKVAFDVLTKNVKVEAGDDSTYKIYVTIWNTEDDNDFPEPIVRNYADSVRYVAETAYTNGTYEAAFELMKRDVRGNYINVAEATITFYVTENVAVENNTELAGVNVYPNPSNGTFNVAVPERARIDIFGLNGAKVMSREANAGVESFSINHSGIYFVRVMAGNKAAVKRVVVR